MVGKFRNFFWGGGILCEKHPAISKLVLTKKEGFLIIKTSVAEHMLRNTCFFELKDYRRRENMPPKPKFTKQQMVEAALQLISEKGVESLTARELGKVLGTSARPIFTIFRNMEELQEEVRKGAMHFFETYKTEFFSEMPYFKRVGMRMIIFAAREPKLYQFLFMQKNYNMVTFEDVFQELGVTANRCIEAICTDYELSEEEAKEVFRNVWIYTFGVGSLCATWGCQFSEEELGQMLSTEFQAILIFVKSKK